MSKSTVDNWFVGKTVPDLVAGLRLARAFDVPLEWLADDTVDELPVAPSPPRDETQLLDLYRALRDAPYEPIDAGEALRRLARPSGPQDLAAPLDDRILVREFRRLGIDVHEAIARLKRPGAAGPPQVVTAPGASVAEREAEREAERKRAANGEPPTPKKPKPGTG